MLGVWVLKAPKTVHSEEPGRVLGLFRRLLVSAMRARWRTIALTLAAFALSLLGTALVPQQFFPSSDRPELLVDLTLPQNASIAATRDLSARMDKLLAEDKDVERWSTYVGRGAIRFYLPMDLQLPNDYFSQLVVVTKGLEQALETDFPNVVGRVYPLELGPPVGWPLQCRVSGADPEHVREIAFKVAQIMGSHASVQKVNFNWVEPARMVKIRVDQDQARLLGLSSQDLSQSINAVVTGTTVTQMRDWIYLVDVVARASAEQRMSLATIRTLQVALPNGQNVPLSQLASVEYGQEYPLIWRRDRQPTLTVQADVTPNTLPAMVVRALAGQLDDLKASLPPGYAVSVGGTVEESGKSQGSVIAVVPLMLLLMLTILMIQLQGFNRLFLVLSVAPPWRHRRGRGSACLQQAARLRGHSGGAGPYRHDRPQFGHPH